MRTAEVAGTSEMFSLHRCGFCNLLWGDMDVLPRLGLSSETFERQKIICEVSESYVSVFIGNGESILGK